MTTETAVCGGGSPVPQLHRNVVGYGAGLLPETTFHYSSTFVTYGD